MNKYQAFEYMVIKLAMWYMEQRKELETFADFNRDNDFGDSKLQLLPFLICTANGDREDLFGLFNSFVPKAYGNIESELQSYNPINFKKGLFNLEITNPKLLNLTASQISELKPLTDEDAEVKFKANKLMLLLFTDNSDELNDESAALWINNSINCFIDKEELNIPDLITFQWKALSTYHRRHSSYQLFSSRADLLSQFKNRIPTFFLVEEKSVFAHALDKRVYA